ncbi:MAG: iron ABC transporter permease [Clostridia bacterium]|nr:iron ABC transporter permease [Clostridia bacterium]
MKRSAKSLQSNKKISLLFLAAVLLFLVSAALGLLSGSASISLYDIINAVKNGPVGANERIFIFARLPRTIACLLVGSALSVAGAIMQNVLANKLASPGIVGVNSGAGLAITLCTAFGLYGGWRMSFFSFIGAFLTAFAVSLIARRFASSNGSVILIGVAINSILNAFSDAIITLFPNIAMMSADFRIGDFSAVTYHKLLPSTVIILITLTVAIIFSKELDVITLGEESARGLGLNVRLMRTVFLIISALLAGAAVSLAGLISFVGLIVPHAVRLMGITRSKHLLPLCALFGAGFVTLCDTVAKTVFSPYEIQVGIIMAFLGAPFFIFVIIKKKGVRVND